MPTPSALPKIPCYICQKGFASPEALRQHLNAPRPHPKCLNCLVQFLNQVEHDIHVARFHGMSYICLRCDKKYQTDKDLQHHYQDTPVHPKCDRGCRRGFLDDQAYTEHITQEHKRRCSTCEITVETLRDLREHYRNSPKHPCCASCERGFKDQVSYNAHSVSVHTLSSPTREVRNPVEVGSPVAPRLQRSATQNDTIGTPCDGTEESTFETLRAYRRANLGDPSLPCVYQNLASALSNHVLPTLPNDSHYRKLFKEYSEDFALNGVVLSLAKSQAYRVQLLEMASELGYSNDKTVRLALREDEAGIAELLRIMVLSESEERVVLRLEKDDAQSFSNVVHGVLAKGHLSYLPDESEMADVHRKLLALLVKLSKASGLLPEKLSVSGVQRIDPSDRPVTGGGFADIFRAVLNGEEVALKRLRVFTTDRVRSDIHKMIGREALVWHDLKHKNILPFLGLDMEAFPSYLCMVSPWMEHGDIMSFLESDSRRQEDVETLLFEVVEGLAYMHKQKVVHGDLRGANILIDNDRHARLADFGLVAFTDVSLATSARRDQGSPRWTAPEVNAPERLGLGASENRRTLATDMYAFACVVIEVYTMRKPFTAIHNEYQVLLQAIEGYRPERPKACPEWPNERDISDKLWNIVQHCWTPQPRERLSACAVAKMMVDSRGGEVA